MEVLEKMDPILMTQSRSENVGQAGEQE